MSEHSVTQSTFTLERNYPESPDQVFAAWANPEIKRRWFANGNGNYQLDFRVGGLEINRANHNGTDIKFESLYCDIVTDKRIVYTSVLSQDGSPATVSLTTIEFGATNDGTRLILTEHGAFLDELEKPEWREGGTSDWLNALGPELRSAEQRADS